MSDKAAKKKQYILDTARKVFAEKGFKSVTMKDIVDACEISRGGLYIYFDNTSQILEEILAEEAKKSDDVFERTAKKCASSGDLLALFLNEQKKELLMETDDLQVALYEYLFTKHSAKVEDTVAKPKFSAMVDVISHLIEDGIESGEFYADDAGDCARNIMYIIEGLKIASKTYGITEEDVDRELLYIMSGLIADE